MSFPIVSFLLGTVSVVCIILAIVLVGVGILLYFTLFHHLRLKRQAKELTSVFETDHSLFFGQDNQFVRRLETISSMNFLYLEDYSRLKKDFQTIRDIEDASAQAAVNSLRDLVDARRYKDLKEYLPIAKDTIESYHSKVQKIDKELHDKFKGEEVVLSSSLKEKENYRAMKQLYLSEQEKLSLVSESFEKLFKKIDELFETVDDDIQNARYSDATECLSERISPVVSQCTKTLSSLPDICVTITNIIPEKIISLRNRYDELTSAGYPLNHIVLKADMAKYEEDLSRLSSSVKALELRQVGEELDGIIRHIEDCFKSFEEEIHDREIFERELASTCEEEGELANSFFTLNHSMPKVRQVFMITSEDDASLEEIKMSIEKASNAKRALDTCLHSGTKQPYSVLLEKLDSLKKETAISKEKFDAFSSHLNNLKEIANKAAMAVNAYNIHLEESEETIRSFRIEAIEKKALPILEDIYKKIDALYKVLHTAPINCVEAERLYNDLQKEADLFLSDVEKTNNELHLAEKNIVLANRGRSNDEGVNNLLLQSENFFEKGDFKNALSTSEEALENIQRRSSIVR